MAEAGGRNWKLEGMKILYSMLLAVAGLCLFALLLDLFCLIFLGGWTEDKFLGQWPVLTGTLYGILFAPWFSSLSVILGFTAIARVILGKHTPALLKNFESE